MRIKPVVEIDHSCKKQHNFQGKKYSHIKYLYFFHTMGEF